MFSIKFARRLTLSLSAVCLASALVHLVLLNINPFGRWPVEEDTMAFISFLMGVLLFLTARFSMVSLFFTFFPRVPRSFGVLKPNLHFVKATGHLVRSEIEERWAVLREISEREARVRETGFPHSSNTRMNVSIAKSMIGYLRELRRAIRLRGQNIDSAVDLARYFGYLT